MKAFVAYIMTKKWVNRIQMDEAVKFLKEKISKEGEGYALDEKALDEASGVGINLSD